MFKEAYISPGERLSAVTFVDVLRARAAQQPQKIAFTFITHGEETNLTYADLDRKAKAIAVALRQHDIAGERVLLAHPAGLDYVAAFFGCLYAGAIAVPTTPLG